MKVARFDIRLLGDVSILVDGAPRKLLPQTAKALAMLVSARNPVPQNSLAAALGQSPDWPVPDVAPPLSRLRTALSGSELDIPPAKWSHAYELVERVPGYLAATVDAARFEAGVRRGRELYDAGELDGALTALRDAASEWRGAPFASLAAGWSLPWVCESHRARLEEQRGELVRLTARIALRLGRHEEAAFVTRGTVGEGQDDTAALWLLRFLTGLREDGGASARRVADRRGSRSPNDDAARRAMDLLALHEHGFDATAPLGTSRWQEQDGPEELIGRQHEIGRLTGLVRRLSAGRSAALALTGEGGVGKSRLLREAERVAARERVLMVTVMCQDLDGLQPWRELAGAVWGHLRRDLAAPPEPITPRERESLGKLMSAGVTASPARPGHERDPRELTFLLVSLLRRAAGNGLLVALDNAHLLGSHAVELLQHVRKGLETAPVGFLLATRQDSTHWDHIMDTLAVAPLTVDEVATWLGRAWGREPSVDESKEAVRVTDGLPLELCRLTETGGPLTTLTRPLDGSAPATPGGTARDLLAGSLDGSASPDGAAAARPAVERVPAPRRPHDDVSPATGAGPATTFVWLAAAAITAVGRDIDPALVARMLDLTPEDADRRQALAASGNTVKGHDRVRFTHDRSREDVLEELKRDPALARDLHRRAFEALTGRVTAGGWMDPSLPVRVAQHARADGAALPEERTAAACLDAARAEQRGFGVGDAVTWAEEGLRLRADAATRVGLLITLGDALGDGGDMEQAGRRYLEAYQAAGAELPRPAATAAIRLARRWSPPGQIDQQLVHLLSTALTRLSHDTGEEAAELRLQLTAHLAKKHTMAVIPGDGAAGAVELARATLRELPEGGDDLVRCEVLTECRWALYDHAGPAELLGIATRLQEAGIRAGSAHFQGEALVATAIDQLRLGRLADALATVDRHRSLVTRDPRSLGPWLRGTLDTLMDLWNGDFARAEQRITGESLPMVQELSANQAMPAETLNQTLMGQYFWLLYERGRMEELFDLGLARQIEQHGYFPVWRAAHVVALCETGRHDEAADHLAAVMHETSFLRALPPHGWAVPTLAALSVACHSIASAGVQGTLPGVRGTTGGGVEAYVPLLRERLSAHPRELVLAGWPTVLMGPTARFRGLLAMTAGAPEEALDHFAEATRMVSAAPPHMARIQLDRAKALLRLTPDDPTGEATRLLHRSLKLAGRLGMPSVAAEARLLLRT
ncbi:AAA family ATPase [Sphaerisporangium rubeum]|uniref:AAA family ATPase n=1 Tax=Sphaerisporangium rubeum TaxID=321317 RepID=UPI0031E0A71B